MPKLLDATYVTYDDVDYAIYPFSAMTAAGVMGDLTKYIGPIASALAPLFSGNIKGTTEDEIGTEVLGSVMKMNFDDLVPVLQNAFSSLDGAALQRIISSLLTKYGNISYEYVDDNGRSIQKKLTTASMDELFIGNLDGMFKLCVDVVRVNYSGFFTNLLPQSGSQQGKTSRRLSKNTEDSTGGVSVL